MKSILVPVGPRDEGKAALHVAARTARRFGALIEGVPIRMPVIPSFDWGIGTTISIADPGVPPEQVIAEARTLFYGLMQEHGIPITDDSTMVDGPAAIWNGDNLLGNENVGRHGRAFALTCVSRPDRSGEAIATLEAALFDSGGPILIGPPGDFGEFGRSVALVWNGSDETARSLSFAMPFLREAERVLVLADEAGSYARPAGALIRRRLIREGIATDLRLLPERSVLSGATILEAAQDWGCDLMIKGAYTQSRIRQIIFGGATKHILAHARMPVFMAH